MSVYLLVHREVSRFENQHSWLDKWCAAAGMVPIVVDLLGDWPQDGVGPPIIVPSVNAAQAVLPNLTWVWLDPAASAYLDAFEHPANDVVYCIGSDFVGFNGEDGAGPRVRVRGFDEVFAAMIAPIVCYERILFDAGMR